MSFPVENIRALCKKRGTSLAALERSLGFGNGVIAGWETAKSYPPYDRVSAVAAALGVSIEELTGEKVPASVSESGRPYVDLDTKMIWAPTPVSVLAAKYDVPSPVLAEIVGCNTDRASFMIFGTVNPTDDVRTITKQDVQIAVNAEDKIVSAKTVANAYGLIRPVLKECGVDVFGVRLPQVQKPVKKYLQPEDIGKLVEAV